MGYASTRTDLARVAVRNAYGQAGTLTVGGESVQLEGVLRREPIEILSEYDPPARGVRTVYDIRDAELDDLVPVPGATLVTGGATWEVTDTERGPVGTTILVLGRQS